MKQLFVVPRLQTDYDHRFAAGVDKVPWRIVDGDMDMADTRRHIKNDQGF